MKSRLSPKDLPHIKGQLIAYVEDSADPTAKKYIEPFKEATLSWVSPDLTALIRSAAETLPEDAEKFDPQEKSGFIFFGAPTGVTSPVRTGRYNSFGAEIIKPYEIVGVGWGPSDNTGKPGLFGFTYGTEGRIADTIPLDSQSGTTLMKFLDTALLLMKQEDLTEESEENIPARGGKRKISPAWRKDSLIKIHRLKQTPHEYTPAKDSKGKWKLDHRVLVSGHWKKQPYGKEWGLRKDIYVRPYIKGPEGERLVIKPTVTIWDK